MEKQQLTFGKINEILNRITLAMKKELLECTDEFPDSVLNGIIGVQLARRKIIEIHNKVKVTSMLFSSRLRNLFNEKYLN